MAPLTCPARNVTVDGGELVAPISQRPTRWMLVALSMLTGPVVPTADTRESAVNVKVNVPPAVTSGAQRFAAA